MGAFSAIYPCCSAFSFSGFGPPSTLSLGWNIALEYRYLTLVSPLVRMGGEGVSLLTTFFFITLVFVASVLQAATGFGFSIMVTPLLILLYPLHDAIGINIILSLLISCVMIFLVGREVDKPLLLRLIIGTLIGVPLGLGLFLFADVSWLKLLTSALILMLTGLLIAKVQVKRSNTGDLVAGGMAGLLTASLGMPGPPLLIYLTGMGMDKEKLRSTTLTYFVFVYSLSLGIQIYFTGITRTVGYAVLESLPLVFLGIFWGQRLFKYLNQKVFTRIIYVILLITGLYLLFTNLKLR